MKRLIWSAIGIFVAIAVGGTLLGFGLGWFNRGVEVVSPTNVTEQHRQVIGKYEAMQAAANNACSAQRSESSEDGPTLVEGPELAYAATVRSIAADYNRRMENLFEAKLVAPAGYPDEAPFIDQGPDTDWCAVAADLAVYP
ncbi:hypothetical protein [Puerhibacterium puerhi]|uniref:hypothetical protein n=1 Tax=Puerhibacterium puerhi TaxID=2692623 RepID=UPI00135A1208|nr:hypothetical protein [Puerhibacterium puerhi]